MKPLSEPFVAIFFSAILTWALHSSLAAVLLYAALAAQDMIAPGQALYLVIGANLGAGFIALSATYRDGWGVRRLSVMNIIMKFTTAIVILSALPFFREHLMAMKTDLIVLNLHTGFNIVLALLFLPLTGMLARFAMALMPDRETTADEFTPLYLDERSLAMPVVALAGAARETLRIADLVERMLRKTMQVLEHQDERLIDRIKEMDTQVDQLNHAIKLYLTRLSLESFDPKEADRYLQILTFSTNLEYCGDIITQSLMGLAEQKIREEGSFSESGLEEIKDFHARILSNLELAQAIFMSEDPELAIQLVERKKSVREAESETSNAHFKRLRERHQQTMGTSSIHLDIIRDFRRINSYVTSVAYTILENQEKHSKNRKKKKPLPPSQPASKDQGLT
jgi:phosphate:Na+ symporter